jgi:hypothetical protein
MDFMLNTKSITVQEEKCPEWFTDYTSAAEYAGGERAHHSELDK